MPKSKRMKGKANKLMKSRLTMNAVFQAFAEFMQPYSDRVSIIVAFSLLESMVSDVVQENTKHPQSYANLSSSLKLIFFTR